MSRFRAVYVCPPSGFKTTDQDHGLHLALEHARMLQTNVSFAVPQQPGRLLFLFDPCNKAMESLV